MQWFLATLVKGAVTFAATNLDDIFILTLFFSRVGGTFRRWHVVAGQYLGFTALVLISLLGFAIYHTTRAGGGRRERRVPPGGVAVCV